MELIPGGTYFLLGYLDERCTVPFSQTLVYLGLCAESDDQDHDFVDAIAWYRNGCRLEGLDINDTLLINVADLETIKDLAGLVDELARVSTKTASGEP